MRIVSLLPSLTEIVAALGLGDSIVGLTHSCDYPKEAVEGKVVVTSTEISPYTMSQAQIHTTPPTPPACAACLSGTPRGYRLTDWLTGSLTDWQAEIHTMVCGALANGHSLYGLDAKLIEAADADIILTQVRLSEP